MTDETDGNQFSLPGETAKPQLNRSQRLIVGIVAGGVTALVALLLTPLLTFTTPVELSFAQIGVVAALAGLVVTADSVRQSYPGKVIVRTSYIVSVLVVVVGFVLGVYVYLELSPTQLEQGEPSRYLPLVPVIASVLLGLVIGGFGKMYRRRTRLEAFE